MSASRGKAENGRPAAQTALLTWNGHRGPDPRRRLLRPDFSRDHRTEQFTVFTVESRHLHLLDWEIVGWACVDLDARQQQAKFEILEVGGLSHHVLAGEFVAALLEHLNDSLRCQLAIDTKGARLISLGKILVHE